METIEPGSAPEREHRDALNEMENTKTQEGLTENKGMNNPDIERYFRGP